MKIKKLIFAMAAAAIIVGLCATTLQWQLSRWKSAESPDLALNEKIWTAISCRVQLYLQKAQGKIPELSWSEVWGLSQPGGGFICGEGRSLRGALQFSSIASADDRKTGARIFHERCSVCHGNDGSGGS